MEPSKKEQVLDSAIVEVHEHPETNYISLFATTDIEPQMVISRFGFEKIVAEPSSHTLQVGLNQHIILKPEFLQYTNHSCDPNSFFDIKGMELIALKPIMRGEEVTFFYPSTEWRMQEVFDCNCGNENCLKRIQGGAFLNYDSLIHYKLSDYIIHQYSKLAEIQYQKYIAFKPCQPLTLERI